MTVLRKLVFLAACVAATMCISLLTLVVHQLNPSAHPEPQQSNDGWSDVPVESVPIDLEPFRERLGLLDLHAPGLTEDVVGWSGLASLGDQCVVGVMVDAMSLEDGNVRMGIMSYDSDKSFSTGWTADYDSLKDIMSHYIEWCNGGEWPGYLPYDVLHPKPRQLA